MAPVAREAKTKHRKRGLPSLIDHEKWFIEIADLALARADEKVEDPEFRMSAGEYARLLDTAIKARSKAADMAAERDDFERMERLERSAEALQARRDTTVGKSIH